MANPETDNYEDLQNRAAEKISDMVLNIAGRRKLPSECFAIIHDEITGRKVGATVEITWLSDLTAKISLVEGGTLRNDDVLGLADDLIQNQPEVPLICDNKTADELSQHSLTWISEDHYRLEGRPNGVLEIYTPYKAVPLPEVDLPDKRISGQLYTE